MALMDTLRQLMKGRSETLERGIDKAIGQLGRYGDTLKKQAEAVKAQARHLDADRGTGGAAAPDKPSAPPPTPPASPPTPPTTTTDPPPAPPVAGGSLRGDLVGKSEPETEPPPA